MADTQRQYTTIPVTPEMRDRLRERKQGGASYEDVLDDLLRSTDN